MLLQRSNGAKKEGTPIDVPRFSFARQQTHKQIDDSQLFLFQKVHVSDNRFYHFLPGRFHDAILLSVSIRHQQNGNMHLWICK